MEYLSWESLEERPEAEPTAVGKASGSPITAIDTEKVPVSPEFQALLDKQKTLENQMKRITGEVSEDSPEQARQNAMFQVQSDTPEQRKIKRQAEDKAQRKAEKDGQKLRRKQAQKVIEKRRKAQADSEFKERVRHSARTSLKSADDGFDNQRKTPVSKPRAKPKATEKTAERSAKPQTTKQRFSDNSAALAKRDSANRDSAKRDEPKRKSHRQKAAEAVRSRPKAEAKTAVKPRTKAKSDKDTALSGRLERRLTGKDGVLPADAKALEQKLFELLPAKWRGKFNGNKSQLQKLMQQAEQVNRLHQMIKAANRHMDEPMDLSDMGDIDSMSSDELEAVKQKMLAHRSLQQQLGIEKLEQQYEAKRRQLQQELLKARQLEQQWQDKRDAARDAGKKDDFLRRAANKLMTDGYKRNDRLASRDARRFG